MHGNVKPQNALVFQDREEKHTAKMTDFVYSCLGSRDQDHIKLPKSEQDYLRELKSRGEMLSGVLELRSFSEQMNLKDSDL